MRKIKLNRAAKIIAILVAIPVILITFFAVLFVMAKINQVTQAEADKVCQDFFREVKADISAVPGYTVIDGDKSCRPDQEYGFTDYYFNVSFRVSKANNNTVAAIKSNLDYLSEQLPLRNYPVWIRNDAAKIGQPKTICVSARKQIQENGEVYNSFPPKHYAQYTEPGSIEGFAPCAYS